jgi:hypothetical protein
MSSRDLKKNKRSTFGYKKIKKRKEAISNLPPNRVDLPFVVIIFFPYIKSIG